MSKTKEQREMRIWRLFVARKKKTEDKLAGEEEVGG
jgi:hypothetical protein